MSAVTVDVLDEALNGAVSAFEVLAGPPSDSPTDNARARTVAAQQAARVARDAWLKAPRLVKIGAVWRVVRRYW